MDKNNAHESNMELEPSQSPRPTSNVTTSTSLRKRNKTDELSEVFEVLKSAKKKMDEKEKKDSFDIYGEYIAAELRSVKDDRAVTQAQYHINNILYELKMGRYISYGYQTASSHPSSTPNNVQEIERQETSRLDATQDEIEDSAILNLVNYLSDESTQ